MYSVAIVLRFNAQNALFQGRQGWVRSIGCAHVGRGRASGPYLHALGARVVSERVPRGAARPGRAGGLLTPPLCLAEISPGHGKSPDHKGRASSLLHKPEFPDSEMMEVLI